MSMNFMSYLTPDFIVERDDAKCISCRVCERQCTYGVHEYIAEEDKVVVAQADQCVGCHRCEKFCPTNAITIRPNPSDYRPNANWSKHYIHNIYKQAETGGVLLTGMGNDKPYRIYWDHMVLNASQVTNPSIDPLREPMELRTYIGKKPERVEISVTEDEQFSISTQLSPQLELETPIMFSAMSYGSINLNVCRGLAIASSKYGTYYNTGEGGLHRSLYKYAGNTIAQVASGRFGVSEEYLKAAAALEIKIGQGAKPGIGGHLPGEKVNEAISVTRMIPVGTDALSPAPHHDIYSIEDLRQLIYALKETTGYTKPVGVKIAAVHNSAAIASGMVRAGADYVVLDGLRGGTGAAPTMIRDNVGIPIEMALASVDDRLRQEGIRNQASIVMAGGTRCSADIVKAIALGADAVYIATSALVAGGCAVCQKCYTGKCPWGIATNDPYIAKRINPEIAAERLYNLLNGWSLEIKEMLGGMGVNSIESLRGNRLHLRGIGLNESEMEILGILPAGR
jgi:glutamate synthase domain-containing protein 2